ncbi:MAG: hypothetical protein Q613_PSC00307G0001, partial [Propionibacterium sp. DORA_15]
MAVVEMYDRFRITWPVGANDHGTSFSCVAG